MASGRGSRASGDGILQRYPDAAIRSSTPARIQGDLMWVQQPVAYVSPVESGPRDDIADLAPEDFFEDMAPLDARRG